MNFLLLDYIYLDWLERGLRQEITTSRREHAKESVDDQLKQRKQAQNIKRRLERIIPTLKSRQIKRSIRDGSNPFEMVEEDFQQRYRLSRKMAWQLIEDLSHNMRQVVKSSAVPRHYRVLAALQFFGHGNGQKTIAANNPMSQPTVSHCIEEVVQALNSHEILMKNICFPRTAQKRRSIIEKNNEKCLIPGVLGYVGCLNVKTMTGVRQEENHKGSSTTPIKVQFISDSDMIIMNVNARFPGTLSDSSMWENSNIRLEMEEIHQNGEECLLLGFSSHPLEPWLLVPYENPEPSTRESNFNACHSKDKTNIETTFRILTNRFRCLNNKRWLQYQPGKLIKIVNACAILHNKCLLANIPLPEKEEEEEKDVEEAENEKEVEDVERMCDLEMLEEAKKVRARIAAKLPEIPNHTISMMINSSISNKEPTELTNNPPNPRTTRSGRSVTLPRRYLDSILTTKGSTSDLEGES